MSKIQALQIGKENWNDKYILPEVLNLIYMEVVNEEPKDSYDLVLWDREPQSEEMEILYRATKAATLFVTDDVQLSERSLELFESKKGKRLEKANIQQFLLHDSVFFYANPYGGKLHHENIEISREFKGEIRWNGQYELVLQGEFGTSMRQIVFWRYNIPIEKEQTLDFWLEYEKSLEVEIQLVITRIVAGSHSEIVQRETFTEKQLQNVIHIKAGERAERLFVSINAKGSGELRIIALHNRFSREKYGFFLPGGERFVTTNREEAFAYFEPMDRKPPLIVYFAGYKTLQGFEGYYMMRKMGSPFLLIAEPRLEGGCFYMGSEEYEKMIFQILEKYRLELGFKNDEVILSGISMGSTGALYYGCDLKPHALILGKPLASIGDIAANEQRFRPGGFPTSLDVLNYLSGSVEEEAIEKLNKKFWDKFDETDWINTKLVVSYMIEDDYDATAYQNFISHVQSSGVQLYGKGFHGRHNDNTGGIIKWFLSQYKKILQEDFGRKM